MRARTISQMLTWIARALALSAVALLGRPGEAVADDASPMAPSQQASLLDGQVDAVEVSAVQVGDADEDGGDPPLLE